MSDFTQEIIRGEDGCIVCAEPFRSSTQLSGRNLVPKQPLYLQVISADNSVIMLISFLIILLQYIWVTFPCINMPFLILLLTAQCGHFRKQLD